MLGKLLKKLESAKTPPSVADRQQNPPPERAAPRPQAPPADSRSRQAPPPSHPPAKAEESSIEPIPAPVDRKAAPAPSGPESPKRALEASFLGLGTELRGTLAFSDSLTIHGSFTGSVYAPEGALRIGPEGSADAEIEVSDLQVEGRVRGSLFARNAIELRNGADVQGRIRCLRLHIDEGALFRGPCECFRPAPGKPETGHPPDLTGFFTAARVASVRV